MTKTAQSLSFLLATAACGGLLGCSVKQPSRFENAAMTWMKYHITVGGQSQRLPIPATAENALAGRHVFGYYCVVCHGRDGQGTGVPFVHTMSPPIPSLASPEVQHYSDGQLKWIIENGVSPSGMPASRGILSDKETWQIVVYLRHLPPPGSLGEPRAFTEDEYPQDPASQK